MPGSSKPAPPIIIYDEEFASVLGLSKSDPQRVWTRSQAIKLLRDIGEIIPLGGEDRLRQARCYIVVKLMRSIGFRNFTVIEDPPDKGEQ